MEARAQVDIDLLIRRNEFNDIQISPDGQYFAATVPFEDRTGMAVLRRSDAKVMTSFTLGQNMHVGGFFWVNDKRLVIRIAEKFGLLEQPQSTGELFGLDFDEKAPDVLIGWRASGVRLGSNIAASNKELAAALSVDAIPGDDRNVIVTTRPYGQGEKFTSAEKLDVYTGRRNRLARAPAGVPSSLFHVDNSGVVRFASGSTKENDNKLYHRASNDSEWVLVNDESTSNRVEVPLGFSADNRVAYLQVEQAQGPDNIVAYDTVSGERKELLRDRWADPYAVIRAFDGSGVPVGAMYDDDRPHAMFFDPAAREAKIYSLLQAAFQGGTAVVTSTTRDGKLALVNVASDRDPGKFYLFDTEARQAIYLLSRRSWIKPSQMAETRPVELKARDGLVMRGYLTVPQGQKTKGLPLVVYPHGGPFGIYDSWGFQVDNQILAAAGYAVLQVNYRGSGNYGRGFRLAGARQWGGAMQDDLTDATRWAITQGVADPERICIYGGSYGAYAALMGVAKEPALYRCAVGYVGVYDLPMMVAEDSRSSRRFKNWSQEWIGGDNTSLAQASPNRIVERIKVPVLLAAGGEDRTAPIEHSEKMEQALKRAGIPVETLYYRTEGHGFYAVDHQREFYTRLLQFLDRNIGKGKPETSGK